MSMFRIEVRRGTIVMALGVLQSFKAEGLMKMALDRILPHVESLLKIPGDGYRLTAEPFFDTPQELNREASEEQTNGDRK